MFRTAVVEISKYTFYAQKIFSENHTVYEIMWRNMAQPEE
jgi:hypothetical protein